MWHPALLGCLSGGILDIQQNQLLSRLGFDAAGVEHHASRAEMRKIVAYFEILHPTIVGENIFQQLAQPGNVPLPIAQVVDGTVLGVFARDLETPVESWVGADHSQLVVQDQDCFAGSLDKHIRMLVHLVETTFHDVNILEADHRALNLAVPGFVGTHPHQVPCPGSGLSYFAFYGGDVLDALSRDLAQIFDFKIGADVAQAASDIAGQQVQQLLRGSSKAADVQVLPHNHHRESDVAQHVEQVVVDRSQF